MLEKMTQSAQHNVTWQTSSEYCMLTVPSGRTLNYVSFGRKIQIPEIFGSPSYFSSIWSYVICQLPYGLHKSSVQQSGIYLLFILHEVNIQWRGCVHLSLCVFHIQNYWTDNQNLLCFVYSRIWETNLIFRSEVLVAGSVKFIIS
jgi:hypothetical protein